MADLDEALFEEPQADTSDQLAPVSPVSELHKVVTSFDQQTLQSVNAAPAPRRVIEPRLPILEERSVVGYDRGTASQVAVVQLGSFLIEKVTAYDFILMQRAAAKDGIKLFIVSAWRSYEQQERIYRERHYADGSLTPAGQKKGRAAKPGHSNHQKGTTLDIKTNMTVADLRNSRFSREYLWLSDHASEFGFERTVSSEPWHWEHTAKGLVGRVDPELLASVFLSAEEVAGPAMSTNRSGAGLYMARDAYDRTKAYERSAQMCSTTMSTLHANRAAESIHKSSRESNYITQYGWSEAKATVSPPAFNKASLSSSVYDFTTGLWGDEEPV